MAIDISKRTVSQLKEEIEPKPIFECLVCGGHEFRLESTGGMHFSAGDVWDDIRTYLQCVACGEELPESAQPINQAELDAWDAAHPQPDLLF